MQATPVLGGLKFHGNERPINQRTSYDVFGDRNVAFSDHFDIEFDVSLHATTLIGYILRIKNRESNRIYNLFYDGQGSHHSFRFNEEGKNSIIVVSLNKDELRTMHWFKMKISFDLTRDSIWLTINNRRFGGKSEALPDTYHPVILFGKSDHIIDVPSFAIKNVMVAGSEKYFFELKESDGTIVHDINGKAFGRVSNPEWLLNDAYRWKYKASFKSRSVAGANYNPARMEIYYFNRDSLFIYNVTSGETTIKVFDQPCPVKHILGTNFLDQQRNKLYSYELYYPTPHNDYAGPTIASLDLDTYEWHAESTDKLKSPLHHHGGYLDAAGEKYTIFGGFGNMHYSKDFYSYDLSTGKWSTLEDFTGDRISPRYFSSVGYSKAANAIYIFGGMGNESGEQIVGRKYYYDLHKIDLDTKQITKLWEIPWTRDNVVPVRGMVIADDSSFYTLCYPEHFTQSYLRLYRFSLKDGSNEILGDSIPIYSDKITTNANLYYDSSLNNLYAVVQEFDDDISSDLKVYSLSFPPITASELASYSRTRNISPLAVVLISIALLTGTAFLLFMRRRPARPAEPFTVREPSVITSKPETATRANAIYLFGDFTVRDRKNRDITYMFSAQLKQIFCLILQYSTSEDGISSQRLSNILWPDKPADKVKNSRGVTINHLRKVLSGLDGIELIYAKGHFKIAQTGECYCDYTRCLEIISNHEVAEHRDELVGIVRRGKFLQLSDHPLFDAFKEEMEKKLEPVLLVEIEKSYEEEQYQTTMELTEAVFNIDPLNDIALTFQIKAMQKLRMTDEARLRYQAFALEYRKVMGNEYPHPYKALS